MTYATMFHFLELTLMDLYNIKAKTEDKEKQEKIQKWIDALQDDPSLDEFESILKAIKEL